MQYASAFTLLEKGSVNSWETLGSPRSNAAFRPETRNRGPACVLGSSPVSMSNAMASRIKAATSARCKMLGSTRRRRRLVPIFFIISIISSPLFGLSAECGFSLR